MGSGNVDVLKDIRALHQTQDREGTIGSGGVAEQWLEYNGQLEQANLADCIRTTSPSLDQEEITEEGRKHAQK
jgi:hypothetical protein